MPTAHFIEGPRTWRDLSVPHDVSREREYEVAQTVTLSQTDYENLTEDMLVSRAYLETPASSSPSDAVPLRCILIRTKSESDVPLLIVPTADGRVALAAIGQPAADD